LRKIYASIRDGMATRESHFDLGQPADADEGANDLSERLGRPQQQRTQPAAAAAPAASAPEPEPAAGGEVSPSPSAPVSESVDTDTGEVTGDEDFDDSQVAAGIAPATLEQLSTWDHTRRWCTETYVANYDLIEAEAKNLLARWLAKNLLAKEPKKGLDLRKQLAAAVAENRLNNDGTIKAAPTAE
jgi:hypothetical protein